MNQICRGKFIRVQKKTARKLYNQGLEILIVPNKVDPLNRWGIGYYANKDDGDGFERDFDKVVSYFEYYNCQYNELGKYAAFYAKEV